MKALFSLRFLVREVDTFELSELVSEVLLVVVALKVSLSKKFRLRLICILETHPKPK